MFWNRNFAFKKQAKLRNKLLKNFGCEASPSDIWWHHLVPSPTPPPPKECQVLFEWLQFNATSNYLDEILNLNLEVVYNRCTEGMGPVKYQAVITKTCIIFFLAFPTH